MMAGFFFIAPLPPGSLFPSLLLLVLSSSSVLVESKPPSPGLSSTILQQLFSMDQESARSLHSDGEMSLARHQRDELIAADPLLPHAAERGAAPDPAWPHLLLDFMGQQNRFKGRTKKNVRGCGVQDGEVEERWRDGINQEPEHQLRGFSIQELQ